jgi:hypothetical protein
MDSRKGANFFLVIIAIVTGTKLVRHFDFKNLKFEKPLLDAIYLVTFVAVIVFFIADYRKRRTQ